MQPMPPIPSLKEEKQTLMSICHQGEFFVEPNKIKQSITLEEVSPTTEILEKIELALEEFKEVVHDELTEELSPMRDIQYQGTSICHDFEDPFVQKKNAWDESFQFFEFISPTINTWVQHILQGMPNLIFTRILEDLLHRSKLMNYVSMVYVYD